MANLAIARTSQTAIGASTPLVANLLFNPTIIWNATSSVGASGFIQTQLADGAWVNVQGTAITPTDGQSTVISIPGLNTARSLRVNLTVLTSGTLVTELQALKNV